MTVEAWSALFERRKEDMSPESWWRKETVIGDVRVSTVWLGLDHSFLPDRHLYWETMIFGGEHDQDQWRYESREQALEDHERIISAVREGREP